MCIILHLKNTKISAVTHKLADILQIKHSRARERHAAALEFNSFNHLSSHLAGGNNVSARLDDYLERLGSLLGEHHNLVLTGAMKAAIEAEMSSSLESLYRTAQIEDFIKYALIAGSDSISIEVFGRFVAEVSSFVEFVDYDEIFAQTLSAGVVGDELTDSSIESVQSLGRFWRPILIR